MRPAAVLTQERQHGKNPQDSRLKVLLSKHQYDAKYEENPIKNLLTPALDVHVWPKSREHRNHKTRTDAPRIEWDSGISVKLHLHRNLTE